MKKLICSTFREGYGIDQIRRTMTAGELINFLAQYDEDTSVYLSFDNGYTYGGITVDYEAFIADNTEDIFLNYYNALHNSKHDTFVRMTDDFWNKVGVNSFATAVSEFKKQFESYMNQ